MQTLTPGNPPVLTFAGWRSNKPFIWAALCISIVYFIALRLLFPLPSFSPDSYTYLQAAIDKAPVSVRPIGYSNVLRFFKIFSTSDIALIAVQFFSNIAANLFLFCTCTYFFSFSRVSRLIMFILLIGNPLYAIYSNYILTDAFFSAALVVWFALFIWFLPRPRWYYIAAQMALLAFMFSLRYNAIFLPVIAAVGVLLSRQKPVAKIIFACLGFVPVLLIVNSTTQQMEKNTGIKNFSPFSGWQMTNNVLHIMRKHNPVSTDGITDTGVISVANYMNSFFDTAHIKYDSGAVVIDYMWDENGAMLRYKRLYAQNNGLPDDFKTWCLVGDVYGRFAKQAIMQKPGGYCRYFVLLNVKAYFLASLEVFGLYNTGSNIIQQPAVTFYGYKTNKAVAPPEWLYVVFMRPWRYIFGLLNIAVGIAIGMFYIKRRYKSHPPLFNKTLFIFLCLLAVNFFFIIVVAPSIFRYHVFMVTLMVPFLIYLVQRLQPANNNNNP